MTDETSDPSEQDEHGDTGLDAAREALDGIRSELLATPVEVIVSNHAMGLWELGAIHLRADPPDLGAAALAIDALGCLVEGLGDRLGDDAPAMRDALANIRMAFVQVKRAHEPGGPSPTDDN